MIQRFVALALALTATALPTETPTPSPPPSTTWSVTPADADGPDGRRWIEVDVAPGDVVQEHIAVRNLGSDLTTFSLSAADGYLTDNGRFNMLPSTQESTGPGTWISLPPEVTVPANSTSVVPVEVRIPDNATPGDHAAGVAASITASRVDGSGVGVESRVGIRAIFHVEGELQPSVSVADVSVDFDQGWNPFEPGRAVVRYTVANTGNTQLKVQPNVSLAGPLGFPQGESAHDAVELLPGGERQIEQTISAVWPLGWISAEVHAEADDVEAESSDTAPAVPYTQVALVVLIALVVWFQLWTRRRREADIQARIDQARREGIHHDH